MEHKEQFVGHRRQLTLASAATFPLAGSGLHRLFIPPLLFRFIHGAEHRQKPVEFGKTQVSQRLHLPVVSNFYDH
jgi:hypothetical protein